jgi:hypothetical protein
MADERESTEQKVQVECPNCHHKFWHRVGDALKQAAEKLGDAIGEAKFGQ